MNKLLNIIFDPNGLHVDTGRSIITSNEFFSIAISYHDLYIDSINCIYQSKEANTVDLTFSINDINIKQDIGTINLDILEGISSSKFLSRMPGTDIKQKIHNYFISGISTIIGLFGLLKDNNGNILYPLGIIFPDIDIDINILNKKLYHFIEYYINSIDTISINGESQLKVTRYIMEYISDYWKIFGTTFDSLESDQNQDILCIHASVLGYGKYLESHIKQVNLEFQNMEESIKKSNKEYTAELKKYYDNEILDLIEQSANIKNIHESIIIESTDFLKRERVELKNELSLMKDNFQSDLRISVNKLTEDKINFLSDHTSQLIKKCISELNGTVTSLENKQIIKLKNSFNDTIDRKNGAIKELLDCKNESIKQIELLSDIGKKELLLIQDKVMNEFGLIRNSALEFENNYKERLNLIELQLDQKLELLSTLLNNFTQLKEDKLGVYIKELWGKVESELKKQSKIIIQSAFDETLETLGSAIDKQINEKVEHSIKSIVDSIDEKINKRIEDKLKKINTK